MTPSVPGATTGTVSDSGEVPTAVYLDQPMGFVLGLSVRQTVWLVVGVLIMLAGLQVALLGGGHVAVITGMALGATVGGLGILTTWGRQERYLAHAWAFLRRYRQGQTCWSEDGLRVDADGTLHLGDGSVRAVLALEPVNLAGFTEPERVALGGALAHCAAALGGGQCLQVLAHNRSTDVHGLIQRLWARQPDRPGSIGGYLRRRAAWLNARFTTAHAPDTTYYLVVSPRPPSTLGLESLVDAWVRAHDDRRTATATAAAGLSPDQAALAAAVDDTRRILATRGLLATPLDGPALQRVWRDLDVEAPRAETWNAVRVETAHGPLWARTLYVQTLRPLCHVGWLAPIVALPFASRCALMIEGRAITPERTRVQARLRQLGFQTMEHLAHTGQAHHVMTPMAQEYADVLVATSRPGARVVRLGLYVTVYGRTPDELAQHVAHARTTLEAHDCVVGPGLCDQRHLHETSLPLGRLPRGGTGLWRVLTPTAGACLPALRTSPGHPAGIPLGVSEDGREQVNLDLEAPEIPTQQVMIVGTPGSGKSMMAQLLAWNGVLEGDAVTVMDRSGSYRTLARAIGARGARYLTLLDPAQPPALDGWALAQGPEGVDLMTALHEAIFRPERGGVPLTRWQRGVLEEQIADVYATEAHPLERHLVARLRRLSVEPAYQREREDVVMGLVSYVGSGRYASLLDQPRDPYDRRQALDHPFLVVDTRHARGQVALVAYRLVETLVEWRAAQHAAAGWMRHTGAPAVETVVIDEGWQVIAEADDYLDRLARTSRHMGRRVIFVTQNISDALDNKRAVKLFDAVPVIICGKVVDERTGEAPDWLPRLLHLSAHEAAQLRTLAKEEGHYAQMMLLVRAGKRHRHGVVNVEMCPEDRWLFATDPDERLAREAAEAIHGDLWSAIYHLAQDGAASGASIGASAAPQGLMPRKGPLPDAGTAAR